MIIRISKRALIGIVALGLTATAVVLATVDFDAWAIRRQSVRLVAVLNKPAGETNPVALALRVRRLLGFFAQQPLLQPGEPCPVIQNREDLTAVAGQALLAADAIRVRVLDREFTWTKPRTEARLRLAVDVRVQLGNETSQQLRVYDIDWLREEGRWVISRAHGTDSIRRPVASE
ncbi:MAG: hypothetical protein NTV49_09290 [Kiritimatiellaeota bacterium]|nr:hypothetical protein [Kiritimatiellota bacterium]